MTDPTFSVEAGDAPYFSLVPEWLMLAELPPKPATAYVWATYLVLHWHRGLKKDQPRSWWAAKARMSESTWDACTQVLEAVGALEVRTNVRDLGEGHRQYMPCSYVLFNRPQPRGGVPLNTTPLSYSAPQGVVLSTKGCTAEYEIKDQIIDQTKPLASSLRSEAKATGQVRAQDPVWDAVLAACRINPQALTKTARGACNGAVAQLKAVGATPDQIAAATREFSRRFPGATVTPAALAKHWPLLATATQTTAPAPHAKAASLASSFGASLAVAGETTDTLERAISAYTDTEKAAARHAYTNALEHLR